MPVSPGCLCRFLKKFLPSAEDFLELFSTPTGLDWCVLLGISFGAFLLESNDLLIGQTEPTSSKRERERTVRAQPPNVAELQVYIHIHLLLTHQISRIW